MTTTLTINETMYAARAIFVAKRVHFVDQHKNDINETGMHRR